MHQQSIGKEIWQRKYQYKDFDGKVHDTTVEDTMVRIAEALAEPERNYGRHPLGKDATVGAWTNTFLDALRDFKFLPAGRIMSGAGTGRNVTLMNCYVMGTIEDDLKAIFDNLGEAARTMQQGGGIGYCFSTLRPMGAHVKGVDSDASGPLTFMDVWDSMCRTIMSAGERRGAMMATMHCWHPDIERFIEAKRDPNRLRMFNMSVLVTDDFMEAVKADEDWDLKFNGKVYKTIKAKTLWEKIMYSTYAYAEPGVIFIDRINAANNLWYIEKIVATNPCVEGDTEILTKEYGYAPIKSLIGAKIHVWNGEKWSLTEPKITGHNQDMKIVKFSDGSEIRCTSGHKFVGHDGETRVEAKDLEVGFKLLKHSWPTIVEGLEYEVDAYAQGFFSGDGWVKAETGGQYIGLYGSKRDIAHDWNELSRNEYDIKGGYDNTDTSLKKEYLFFGKERFLSKEFVPSNANFEFRKQWLSGLIDSDGHVTNDSCIQISSKSREFLYNVKLMLNTMGVTGNLSEMKDHYRLSISGTHANELDLPLKNHQVKPVGKSKSRFISVTSVEDSGKEETVYCFTENDRHMGVFGGVLTGQCGEQPLPPYGACLLGSMNLAKFVDKMFTDKARIDWELLESVVKTAVRMLDNVNDITKFPLDSQAESARRKRRMGLGVTGLADMLVMMNVRYGSDESVAMVEYVMKFITITAYLESANIAKEKGAFFDLDIDKYLQSGFMMMMPDEVHMAIEEHGIRNSHLISIAPTGTISMYADNVSSGIEPIFAHKYERKVLNADGSHSTEVVKDYAVYMWEKMFPDTQLNDNFVTAQTITPSEHIAVQAAAQRWVDSSISKTTNVPEDISMEDFMHVYMEAYDTGCKGCTTYRPNEVTGSVLTAVEDAPEAEIGGACTIEVDPNTGQMIRTCDS